MSKYILTNNGDFYSQDELYHYGVLGMKWGRRRALRKEAKAAYRKRTDAAFKEYERTIAGIEKPYKRGQNLSKKDLARQEAAERKYANETAKAKTDYKKAKSNIKAKIKAERALAKIEKQKKKDFIKTRSKELLKGESIANKMMNTYTGAHKIQAEIEYDSRNHKT